MYAGIVWMRLEIASIKFNFENGNDAWLITLSVLFTLLFVNFQRILKMFSK
jgi:hypothetical protein